MSFTLIHEHDPVICYSSRDIKRSIQSERSISKQSSTSPNSYFSLVYTSHTVKDAKSLEESFPYVRASGESQGETGRSGESQGRSNVVSSLKNWFQKLATLLHAARSILCQWWSRVRPTMKLLFSRFRGGNSTIGWIQSVDLIANPISTRFYRSNGIVFSLRLNEERRSSSAVETVCRPWTASPARTHPVEECTTRKRSRNGISCVGAASCGPFAAWRNSAAPFQLTSPATSTPLISSPTIITISPDRLSSAGNGSSKAEATSLGSSV